MKVQTLIASALILGGCSTALQQPSADAEPREIDLVLDWLDGAWSNADQFAAAPDALKRPPAPGHPYDWLDFQAAEFHPVSAPELGEHVAYLEWRRADGSISRQRLWVFRSDADGRLTGMDFFTFRTPKPYAEQGEVAGAFAAVTSDDLIGYPDGCTLQPVYPAWNGVILEVSETDCAITARSGRRMGIRARIELAPDRIGYSEAGILDNGDFAFLVPGGLSYDFRRRN